MEVPIEHTKKMLHIMLIVKWIIKELGAFMSP